jgi:hypothetical protein
MFMGENSHFICTNIVGRIQKQVDDFFKGIVSTIWVIFST